MYKLKVPIYENGESKEVDETVYTLNDFPFHKLKEYEVVSKRRGKHFNRYLNVSCAFDIETSTIVKYRDDGTRYGEGFMYQWQFCLDKYVIFGRTFQELILFFKELLKQRNELLGEFVTIVIYVHNLSYEFQFIKDFILWDRIFAKQKHKVVTANSQNNIEFRCSYFLSNMSFSKLCENSKLCTHYKLTDTYDYSLIRTPATELTNIELAYCYNDVRGLCECIDTYLLNDTLATIPLTNTGYVRRDFRKAVLSNKKNKYLIKSLALNVEQYTLLERMFRGGNTHSNHLYTGATIKNVHSYDMQSSYIGVMMLDYFPMSPLVEVAIDNKKKLEKYTSKYCCMLDIDFFNISIKKSTPNPYIDIAHCQSKKNIVNDNGRVLSADYIGSYPLTEIDLKIIMQQYDIEKIKVNKCYISKRGKLPNEFRENLLKWYRLKTTLKDDGSKVYEYLKSKNRLNSSFGMMVQKIINEDIVFIDNEWNIEKRDLADTLDKHFNSHNTFLAYQWGIYVTAHARRRLQQGIDICSKNNSEIYENDYVYGDTDSCKFINDKHIAEFNALNEDIKRQCEDNDIKAYIDYNNKRYYLSLWEYEGKYDFFKTFGAKKYAYQQKDKFIITVAGMNKKLGSKVIGNMERFELGQEFENVGRTTSWYNEHDIGYITVNGDTFISASNIGILDATYTLGVTREYWELIKINPKFIYD